MIIGIIILVILISSVLFYYKIVSRDNQTLDIENTGNIVENGETDNEKDDKKDDKKGVYLKLTAWFDERFSKIIIKVKIAISTFQVVISTPSTFEIKMPAFFTNFLNTLTVININFATVFPISCSIKSLSFIDSMMLTTLVPILFSILLVISFFMEYIWKRREILANFNHSISEKTVLFNQIKNKYLNYFFYLTYAVLPSVTTTIFQMFKCTNINPTGESSAVISESDVYLTADMEISCDSDYYYQGVKFALIMIIVYPIGIPVLYTVLLYINRKEIMERDIENFDVYDEPQRNPMFDNNENKSKEMKETTKPKQKELSNETMRLQFLWESYKPSCWYWEVVETGRRLFLTAVLSICRPGTSTQSVFAVLLAVLFIKLSNYYDPYSTRPSNILAETGHFQIFFTFFGGLVVSNSLLGEDYNDDVGVMLVLINFGVVYLICYFEAVESFSESNEDDEIEEIDDTLSNSRNSLLKHERSLSALEVKNIIENQLDSHSRLSHIDNNLNNDGIELKFVRKKTSTFESTSRNNSIISMRSTKSDSDDEF
jgi:hypothetical protein